MRIRSVTTASLPFSSTLSRTLDNKEERILTNLLYTGFSEKTLGSLRYWLLNRWPREKHEIIKIDHKNFN